MSQKISLMEMAEAVGSIARDHRSHVERLERDRPSDPLPPTDQWVVRARTFESAHLTLSLMALDEEASRAFVASLIKAKGNDAKLLMGMLTSATRPPKPESEAA